LGAIGEGKFGGGGGAVVVEGVVVLIFESVPNN
jgi:hypothetical protein